MSRDLCGSMVADSWLIPILRMPPRLTGLSAVAGVGAAALAGAAAAAVTTGLGASVGLAATNEALVAGAAAAGAVVAAGLAASVGLAAGGVGWAPQAESSPAPTPIPTVERIRKRRRGRPNGARACCMVCSYRSARNPSEPDDRPVTGTRRTRMFRLYHHLPSSVSGRQSKGSVNRVGRPEQGSVPLRPRR